MYVGGSRKGGKSRKPSNPKTPVLGMVERGGRSDDPVERFTESMTSFFEFAKRIFEWEREEGQGLADTGRFEGLKTAPPDDWITANPVSAGASADAMVRFVGEDDPPDLAGLDDLKATRKRDRMGSKRRRIR